MFSNYVVSDASDDQNHFFYRYALLTSMLNKTLTSFAVSWLVEWKVSASWGQETLGLQSQGSASTQKTTIKACMFFRNISCGRAL